MKIDAETGELVIHQIDVDHILGWFIDGDNLQEAIERELILHGLEEEWNFDANKIIFDNSIETNAFIYILKNRIQRHP